LREGRWFNKINCGSVINKLMDEMKKVLTIIVLLLAVTNLYPQSERLDELLKNNNNDKFLSHEGEIVKNVLEKDNFENHPSQILKAASFDSTSGIDSVIYTNKDGIREKQIYQYLDEEKTYNLIYQLWDGNNWNNDWIHSHQYIDEDKIIKRSGIYWNEGVGDTTWCFYYGYDEFGNLITETLKNPSQNGNWIDVKRYSNTYNSLHQQTSKLEEKKNGSSWINVWQAEYGYDSNGNRNFWLSQSYESEVWQNERRTNASFDEDGNMLFYQVERSVGIIDWELDFRDVYSYNEQSQILHYARDKYENDLWNNQTYQMFEYD